MRPLPARRLESFQQVKVRVQSGSTIRVDRNIYSVPARLYDDTEELTVWLQRALGAARSGGGKRGKRRA